MEYIFFIGGIAYFSTFVGYLLLGGVLTALVTIITVCCLAANDIKNKIK